MGHTRNRIGQVGANLIALMLLAGAAGISFGVAVSAGRKFGWAGGALAALGTVLAVLLVYATIYWMAALFSNPRRARDKRKG
jgi:hypothetical protein